MKKAYQLLIFVFPVIYLVLGFYFRQLLGDLSLRSNDPEYIHFISGLCVATGKFNQANIDHPGAIFQILLAFVFRIIHFIRGSATPFFEDAISNSDLYLAVSNLVITVIASVSMLWAGKITYKITNNLLYALIIQTAPLIILVWYEIIGRIYPELLFVVPIYMLQIQILRAIYNQNKSIKQQIYIYAFIMGLGLSLKMTFVPFIVLPLFLITKYKDKLKYLLFTVIAFFLLSPQVAFQFNHFKNWMKGIFIHSGQYQSGDSNIINTDLFLKNLDKIFSQEHYIFYAIAVLFILLIVLVITKNLKHKLSLISTGIIIAFLGFTFIVGKQYAIRYFFPALLFLPFILILNKEIAEHFFKQKIVKYILSILLIIVITLQISHTIPYIRVVSKSLTRQMNARIQTRNFVQTLDKDSYTIIVSQAYGSPYQEYSIMFSFAMGGKQWPNYREKLNKLYPNRYFYFTWDNTIKYWGKPYNPTELMASGKPVYLYLQKNNEKLYQRTVNKLLENHKELAIKKKLLFDNSVNHEGILQITFVSDTSLISN